MGQATLKKIFKNIYLSKLPLLYPSDDKSNITKND